MYEAELNAIWGLDAKEKEFIINRYSDNRYATHQLAFAFAMKFFDLHTRYPTNNDVIANKVVQFLAQQLDCSYCTIEKFNWKSKTAERYRADIRKFYQFKKISKNDLSRFINWVITDMIPIGVTARQTLGYSYQYFKDKRIEPCNTRKLECCIRLAYNKHEKQFLQNIFDALSETTKNSLDDLLNVKKIEDFKTNVEIPTENIKLRHLKQGQAGIKLIAIKNEIAKLARINQVRLNTKIFSTMNRKLLVRYYDRIIREPLREIMRHPPAVKYSMLAIFCLVKKQLIQDSLADSIVKLVHRAKFSAEKEIKKKIINEVQKVNGKFDILYLLASTSVDNPEGVIKDIIYPKVDVGTLKNLVTELMNKGKWYEEQVIIKMRSSFAKYQRRLIMPLLSAMNFKVSNNSHEHILAALNFILSHEHSEDKYYPVTTDVPIENVIDNSSIDYVTETISKGELSIEKINRINYEMLVLEEFRKLLKSKEIWIPGSFRYQDPNKDLPADFEERKEYYYNLVGLPIDPKVFTKDFKEKMQYNLGLLNNNIPTNDKVVILDKKGGRIKVTPYEPQPEPQNILLLKEKINDRWATINLIDLFKEADLRINFTEVFDTIASRQSIDGKILRKKLLLALFAIASNIGLKRISAGNPDVSYEELKYIKRTFINAANVRAAIIEVVNEIFRIRDPKIWGEATTGCICDSTKLSAWDQNLMTEWSLRHQGPGIMIYWHIDKKAACIHSQIKTCSSSEVAAMFQGVLHHSTKMKVEKSYADSKGKSVIGFAFAKLLNNLDLLPRIKGINKQKLNLVEPRTKANYPNLKPILTTATNWSSVEDQYNEMVKYAVALKLGTAEADVIFKRFSKGSKQDHPLLKALYELGNANRTIFVCRYLASEELRIEINEALNVVERLNSIMHFIFYGKLGEFSTNRTAEQELAVLCLHLLQVCMVYINTLLIQEMLGQEGWQDRLTVEDKRALNPLIYGHLNPYGLFLLDLEKRLEIERKR